MTNELFKNATPSTMLGIEKKNNKEENLFELYVYNSETKAILMLAENITREGIFNIEEITQKGLYLVEKSESGNEDEWMKTKYKDGEPETGGGFYATQEEAIKQSV